MKCPLQIGKGSGLLANRAGQIFGRPRVNALSEQKFARYHNRGWNTLNGRPMKYGPERNWRHIANDNTNVHMPIKDGRPRVKRR